MATLPGDPAALRAHYEERVGALLSAAFVTGGEPGAADAIAREVRSDARHVLPVLAALLGPGCRARLHAFRLTDYGPILGQPPPCVVASALVTVGR